MKEELFEVLDKLNNQQGDTESLGFEALGIMGKILDKHPYDIETLVLRMNLNARVFENTSAIIEDASFIVESKHLKGDIMVGYDWLYWAYTEALAMPDKAQEVLEEQLMDVHSLEGKKHIKDKTESELLNKLAFLKFENDEKEVALNLWERSFNKYPYIMNRNGFYGLILLENKSFEMAEQVLKIHYDWCFNTEDGYRLEFGKKLQELYDAGELEGQADLTGLLFNIMRNEKEHFGITAKLDFFEKYFPELEKLGEKYPDSSLIWSAIANTHVLDTKNYQKAFDAFSKLASTKDAFRFSSIERAMKAAKKSKNDFFDIDFSFNHSANELYNCLTALSVAVDKTKNEKKKKKLSTLAITYGKRGYDEFREYLVDEKGSVYNNHPHIFAMLCNNYANAIGEHADFHFEDDSEEEAKAYKEAGDIHIEGYNMSPFRENVVNAASDYFTGKDYPNAIKYAKESITYYKEDLSVYDFQMHHHRIIRSSIELDDLVGAEAYYLKSKEVYNKVDGGSKDANVKFVFCGKCFYEYAVTKRKEFKKYIPEMEWFLEKEVAVEHKPLEHGLVSYYLGLCYLENNQKEEALKVFQVTVDYLHDADWGFYDTKCEHAEELIKKLGGKVVKPEVVEEVKKSAFRRTLDAILFPFRIFGLIGGLIWAAAMGNYPGGRNEKGDKKK